MPASVYISSTSKHTMDTHARIYVAGHRGLVGSAIVRRLQHEGADNLILRTHSELDLACQSEVERFFAAERPEFVFLAAAKVGGILANSTYPAEFIHDNLAIQTNVIHQAWKYGTRKLLFLGSSCIYPRDCPQPIREDYLLTGPLEPTNEWYATAKIAGAKMCEAYRRQYGFDAIVAMPTNLYGPGDNFHPENSHVIPALIRRFIQAREARAPFVTIWGTGKPRREFLHVDDLASALVHVMNVYSNATPMNIGSGVDIAIGELATLVAKLTNYQGAITLDTGRPDGTPRKLLDVTRLAASGWRPTIALENGLRSTIRWYEAHAAEWG